MVPALQAFYSLSSIVMGGLFFNEFNKYVAWQMGIFAVGIVLSLIGVVVLSKRSTVVQAEIHFEENEPAAQEAKKLSQRVSGTFRWLFLLPARPFRRRRGPEFTDASAASGACSHVVQAELSLAGEREATDDGGLRT